VLRLSSYAILSNRLTNGGYALLSGLSGGIDIINEDFHSVLIDKLNNCDPHAIYFERDFFPNDLLKQFVERGYLTTASHEEEKELLSNIAKFMHERSRKRPSIVIVPDTDCNYRCVYCFEKQLQINALGNTAMSKDTVRNMYFAIDQILADKDSESVQITLYGGEPLNAKNKEIVFDIVDNGRKRGFSFSAITNGHDLDVFIPVLGKGSIEELQITIDGPKAIHDKRRVSLDKTSSYDRIVPNIHRLIHETDVLIKIRINADRHNVGYISELFADFDSEGWLNNEKLHSYVAAVQEETPMGTACYGIDDSEIEEELTKFKNRFSNVSVGSPQNGKGMPISSALFNNSPFQLKSVFCGAVANTYIFLPDGSIASCMEAIGQDHNVIGYYTKDGLTLNEDNYLKWMSRSAASIPECLDCRYCLVCAGGCPQSAINRNGDIYTPCCNAFQESYPAVLATAAEQYLSAYDI